MQSLASQFYAFLITIAIGGVLGMFFDIYRVFLRAVRPRKIFSNLGDLLFWIIASVVCFAMLLMGNWGEVRLYVLIGAGLGLGIYFKVISGYFIFVLDKLIFLIKKFFRMVIKGLVFCWSVVTYPFVLVRNMVIIPVGFVGKVMTKAGRGSKRLTRRFIISPLRGTGLRIKYKIKRLFQKR